MPATDIVKFREGRPEQPEILANVVCVITADGFRNVYHNVSKVGARLP